jgi:hypothetical protein
MKALPSKRKMGRDRHKMPHGLFRESVAATGKL